MKINIYGEKREYGYLSESNDDRIIRMKKGQNYAGYSVGILHIDDVYYPLVPGNVVNACTYDFPVKMKAVPDLDVPGLLSGDPSLGEPIVKAAVELEKEGIRAIAGACGFFGFFQKQVAEAVEIPVCMSSLVQVSWIKTTLKANQRIGVLTADQASINEQLLESCSIEDPELLIIKDLRHGPHFSAILEGRGSFDNSEVKKEVTSAAVELVNENNDIGAILLECSDMPPYAVYVQRAVGLPVFDFITMIRWLHYATTQRPYTGHI